MAGVTNKVEVQVGGRTQRISRDSFDKIEAMASYFAVKHHGVEDAHAHGLHVAEERTNLLKRGVRSALQRWQRWNPQQELQRIP